MRNPMPLGSMVGILGGGQLGRMLSLAASRLGMRTHIYCPDPKSPAFEVTPHRTIAAYEDEEALARFAEAVDVITYEFENVPAQTAEFLSSRKPLRPGTESLAIAQDRWLEKQFLARQGIEIAPNRLVESVADLETALAGLGVPAVLKTKRLGYDGKGQRVIRAMEEAAEAFAALVPKPLVLEGFVPFECEISVVVARDLSGAIAAYDPAENDHRDHILSTSTVPARISPVLAERATDIARKIVEGLDYVGVLGVEFFVLPDDEGLLVNEIAPRVHNSGHWTEAVCITDQFEQHMRAILGWPLGSTRRLADVVMENLLGTEIDDLAGRLEPDMQPHLYGKREARAGRKMGHVNRIGSAFEKP